jgi:hypothetical protein
VPNLTLLRLAVALAAVVAMVSWPSLRVPVALGLMAAQIVLASFAMKARNSKPDVQTSARPRTKR